MNDNRKKPPDTRVVLEGRLAYADQLITPKAFEEGQQAKYGCTILIPPERSDLIDAIEAALEAAATTKWGPRKDQPKRLRGRDFDPVVKDCADYPAIGITEPGWCFVRASTTEPPGVCDAAVKELNPAEYRREIYSGRKAKVSVNAFAYERKTGSGVSLALGNVQLLGHDTRLGTPRPKPGDEFDPAELPDEDDAANDDDFEPARRPRSRR